MIQPAAPSLLSPSFGRSSPLPTSGGVFVLPDGGGDAGAALLTIGDVTTRQGDAAPGNGLPPGAAATPVSAVLPWSIDGIAPPVEALAASKPLEVVPTAGRSTFVRALTPDAQASGDVAVPLPTDDPDVPADDPAGESPATVEIGLDTPAPILASLPSTTAVVLAMAVTSPAPSAAKERDPSAVPPAAIDVPEPLGLARTVPASITDPPETPRDISTPAGSELDPSVRRAVPRSRSAQPPIPFETPPGSNQQARAGTIAATRPLESVGSTRTAPDTIGEEISPSPTKPILPDPEPTPVDSGVRAAPSRFPAATIADGAPPTTAQPMQTPIATPTMVAHTFVTAAALPDRPIAAPTIPRAITVTPTSPSRPAAEPTIVHPADPSVRIGRPGVRSIGVATDSDLPVTTSPSIIAPRPVTLPFHWQRAPMNEPLAAPLPMTDAVPVAPLAGDPDPAATSATIMASATPIVAPPASGAVAPGTVARGNAPASPPSTPRTDPGSATSPPAAVRPAPLASPMPPAPAAIVFGVARFAAQVADDRDEPTAPIAAASMTVPATIERAVAAAPTSPVDVTRDHWPHAMIERIEMIRDAADAADTRIRLVPDALGTIDVDVRRDGDTLDVRFRAEQPQTRALLAEAAPRLAEAAEARGLRLNQSSVGGDATGQGNQPAPRQPLAHAPPRAPRSPVADAAPADDDTRLA